ncbi:MAG: helix-turn-helix transcriptional regulator [Laribacter sp.]|nr:helix-turn-helix transcriptional regulator [Laribacter sp.]MBP9607829.1 helix-turn-helix transcriptional regulator [Laribacter sp.]
MLSTRLQLAMREAGISQAELARACGVKPPSVNGWLSGKSKFLRGENLLAAAKALNVSQAWLATGKGPMHPRPDEELIPASVAMPRPADGYISFDMLDVEAAAGAGCNMLDFPEVVQRVNVLESWAGSTLGGDLSRIKLISARGTSMQGTIENGDVLFVDATIRAYDGDGIYVIARGGDVQVKRLQKLHGDVLAIISDNRAYESERLIGDEANSVVVCGRVLAAWSVRKFW